MSKLILFLFILFPQICLGAETGWVDENGNVTSDKEVADFMEANISNEAKKIAAEMQPVYENMKNCASAESEYLHILGKENELCHFKYVDYDCFVPFDIAEEYAELGLKSMQEMAKGNISTESPEAKRMQEILSNKEYCSYNMTWSVTMEDENGNEIPVEVMSVE